MKFPKVQECLDYFGIKETEPHRADKDAFLEAKIIWELIKIGKYPNFEAPDDIFEEEEDEDYEEDEFGCPDNGDDCEFCPNYEDCEDAS